MKRLILFSVSSVLLLVLAACGNSPTSTNSTSTGSSTGTSVPQSVQITENEFTITSSVSAFTAGVPYHFVVKNEGKTAHEFMIMPKDEGKMGSMSMEHMDGLALAKTGDIGPGETKTIDYTFADAAKGSHPQLVCYMGGHYDLGMKLNANVS